MRLFSWYGLAAVLTAAGCGYVAGIGQRGLVEAPITAPLLPSHEEESTPPPGYALNIPRLDSAESIDLTCPPQFVLPLELLLHTAEPPLADQNTPSRVHQATYEFPAGPERQPVIPYLDDDVDPSIRHDERHPN
jgi:hypothetical protein